jgi:iron complex outermembrane receptor protein
VVLRGFNTAFSGATFVLTDYRQAAVPSLGVNVHSIMPSMAVDVDRVEVVRGPGSALYGPGVDSGVIHYFTKDPFQYPGTTVSVTGGTQQYLAGQFRQAGVLGERFGYKVTGQFARADEWALNPASAEDARELDRYRVYPSQEAVPSGRSAVAVDLDGDGANDGFQLRREDVYSKFNVNGLLQYQVGDATTLSLNGGYAELTGTVQSGIGTLQGDGFGYGYGQLRLQSGSLFAQVFLNANDAGTNTYVYGSGNTVIDRGLQWNGQVQYDVGLPALTTDLTFGADANLTVPRTAGEILGRNEGSDRIEEYGAYVQAAASLTESLELTLAGRLDYNNIVEAVQASPRAALVFKVTPLNSLRATYNRSFSSPGTNSLFLDIEGQRQTIAPTGTGDTFDLIFQARGAAQGFTFNQFRQTNTARFFVPTPAASPFGNLFGQDVLLSQYPVAPVYGAAAQGFASRTTFAGTPFEALPDAAISAFAGLLNALAQAGGGAPVTDATVLGVLDDTETFGYRAVSGPIDIDPLRQTTQQTFELGYRGVLAERIAISVDGYYETKRNFIGPLNQESPLVYLSPAFISGDVQARLAADPAAGDALSQFLQASGLGPDEAIALLTGTFAQSPSGVVQPDQAVLPTATDTPTNVGGFFSYRNFGQVQYWGIDAAVDVQATDALSFFANASLVSDNFFDNTELDETNTSLSLALNAPSFKARGGVDYRFETIGLSLGATGNYVEGFPVDSGPYVGRVDDYFVLDARVGYEVAALPGLDLNLTVQNVLDNNHREFVGAPALGRFITARLTYTLQ